MLSGSNSYRGSPASMAGELGSSEKSSMSGFVNTGSKRNTVDPGYPEEMTL